MRVRALAAALLVSASTALAACGSDDQDQASTAGSTPATTAASCEKASLPLTTAGKLTIATDKPAYSPYFEDDDPTNGKGFESAVAYAIAGQLGFDKADVTWKVVPFNASFKPGSKDFDFDLNQVSINDARKKAVDFSSPYFTTPQAVLALKTSSAAKATSFADLKDAKLGVQVGTTSLDAVTSSIAPSSQPQVFNDSNDVVAAIKSKRVDAVVVDLPTAIYLANVELTGATVVGQFQAAKADDWGAVLAKGSGLTSCVSQAVDKLKADGTLAKLQKQWITDTSGARDLS
jgi:polar amino acid transport system substrate-binding protein